MNKFKFRVYYEWKGRSGSDPFVNEKTPAEITEALDRFPIEFRVRMGDTDASVSANRTGTTEIALEIETSKSEDEVKKAMVPTLQDWRLFGTQL